MGSREGVVVTIDPGAELDCQRAVDLARLYWAGRRRGQAGGSAPAGALQQLARPARVNAAATCQKQQSGCEDGGPSTCSAGRSEPT